MLRHRRSLYGLRGLLRALSLGFFPRVLWHMHLLGVLLFMSLLFLEPAPHMYTYAFLHYAVGKGKERRAFLLLGVYVSVLVFDLVVHVAPAGAPA